MARFRLFTEYGALNSKAVFEAFRQGLQKHNQTVVNDNDYDVAVIWSVLWRGRMSRNRDIYFKCRSQNKPVVIIEVGSLKRGTTWKISLNHTTNLGFFGNTEDLDSNRPKKLNVFLKPEKQNRKDSILIACQHTDSLQWQNMPSTSDWLSQTVNEIRKFSGRPIKIRPHPRNQIAINIPGAELIKPQKIVDSYDDFDFDFDHHCVINHNSGPAVQSALNGAPVICDRSSLAYPVSIPMSQIENPIIPDREDWFLKLVHTEWLIEEISAGIPLARLLPGINLSANR
jgi:hypothetical protein